jgi:hypothetical protein
LVIYSSEITSYVAPDEYASKISETGSRLPVLHIVTERLAADAGSFMIIYAKGRHVLLIQRENRAKIG